MSASIIKYSHHFTVSGFSRDMKSAIWNYLRAFQDYESVYVRGQGYKQKASKIYAESNKSRSVVRMHINQLDAFLDYMDYEGFPKSMFSFTAVEMYKPTTVKLKMNEKYSPREYQGPMIDYLTADGSTKLLTLQTGKGKALTLDTPVLTPNGYTEMGNIVVGSEVISKDGSTTKVKRVYPQGELIVWELVTSKGTVIECCKDHLWEVVIRGESFIMDTKTIRDHLKLVSEILLPKYVTDTEQPKVVSVKETIRKAEMQCITVDHPSSLFVIEDETVTHNTYCALEAIKRLQTRCMLIVPAKYLDKWVGDVIDAYGPKTNLAIFQGGKALRDGLSEAKDGTFDADFIIASSTTIYNYFKEFNSEGLFTYDVTPYNLFNALGVGVRLIDEAHENIHLNFRIDLYTHVPKTINLSATVMSKDPLVKNVLEIMFPLDERAPELAYDKYVDVYAINYRLKSTNKLQYKRRKMYSHIVYEEWIMSDKDRLERYLDMIFSLVSDVYISRNILGQKALIFAANVELCKAIAEAAKKKWPDRKISTKVSEDDFSVLEECDIIVSTVLSTGTAVDIDGLSCVFMTIAINSITANLQALGRLRKLKGEHADQTPEFFYFNCMDIDKHLEYHREKEELFEGRALTHRTIYSSFRI